MSGVGTAMLASGDADVAGLSGCLVTSTRSL